MASKHSNFRECFGNFSQGFLPRIDSFIKNYYDEKISSSQDDYARELYGVIAEYCLRDGKRIRPLLLLASYIGYRRFFKKTDEVLKLAAVVELMHSFLLIQDDIIDRSETRRGGKSLHILLGEKYGHLTHNPNIGPDIAIVLADIIFSNAMEIIYSVRIDLKVKNRFLEIFSKTYEKTAWGQILDSLNSMVKTMERGNSAPMKIGLMKTAWYTIVYPMMMGYVLSGGKSNRELRAIEEFAIPLGEAFQIRDDILGVFGKEESTGKPGDSDILEGKFTMLIYYALEILGEGDGVAFSNLLLKKNKSAGDVSEVRNMLERSGALKKAMDRHGALIEEAREKLKNLAISRETGNILTGILESLGEIKCISSSHAHYG